jgi:hypothetical protein
MPEVTLREPGVFAADFYLTAEAQVIANKDPCPCYKPGGVGHVVAVPNSDNPAEVRIHAAREGDGHDPEVSGSLVAERVGFLGDGEPAGFQLALHFAEDGPVAERIPGLGSGWCRHGEEFLAADGLGSAVKQHPTHRSLSAGLRVFDDVHRVFSFLVVGWFSGRSGMAEVQIGLEIAKIVCLSTSGQSGAILWP